MKENKADIFYYGFAQAVLIAASENGDLGSEVDLTIEMREGKLSLQYTTSYNEFPLYVDNSGIAESYDSVPVREATCFDPSQYTLQELYDAIYKTMEQATVNFNRSQE